MGKYDTNKEWSRNELIQFVANELAEANRLKRLEMELNNTSVPHETFKEICRKLEDKA